MRAVRATLTPLMNDLVPDPASPAGHGSVDELLSTERVNTVQRIASLTGQFDTIVESCALATNDDEHDPEGATIAFERAQVAALRAQAREHLIALDQAVARLRNGTYGACERCGQVIAPQRLVALPAVRTCIGCASRIRR